jgi:Spy/CpxP family protein refolding chaperone
MKIKNLVMAGMVMVFCASVAMAGPGERDHEKMFKKLNLGDAQIQQLKEIHSATQAQVKPLRDDLKKAHKALHDALAAETPDMNAVDQIKDQIKTLQGKLLDLRVDSMSKTRQILTPEQFKKLGEHWDNKRSMKRAQDDREGNRE